MQITRIEVFLLKRPLTSPMHISRGGFKVRQHALVKVHTDTGITGLGEGVGNAPLIKTIIDSQLSYEAVGLNPMNVEQLRAVLSCTGLFRAQRFSSLCRKRD